MVEPRNFCLYLHVKGLGNSLGLPSPLQTLGSSPASSQAVPSWVLQAASAPGSVPKQRSRSSQGRDHLSEAAWELAVQAEHVTTCTGVSTGRQMEPAPGAEASAGLAPGTADERQREH